MVAPVGPVGHLLPLGGAVGEELWGGSKALSVSVWGGVTNHMHWGGSWSGWLRPAGRTRNGCSCWWKDDGDLCFRMYMVRDGSLLQRGPQPAREGYDRPW